MSTAAIQQVLTELQNLPESDQQLVLGFLRALRCKHAAAASPPARRGANAALEMIDGLLVFTGALEAPNLDWVKVVRDERDEGFVHQALGRNERR
ncbi:MAG: hypothetical protein DME25_17105 [Verrucomicrobia bacterium]|nr:MAG: hypothetical protein DME25_17105 [Verrucomicrobiota bacterium]